jgi:hypothetical protein
VAEGRIRVLLNVALDPFPVALIVADLFAVSADGQQAAQIANLGQSGLQLADKPFPGLIGTLALLEVSAVLKGDGRQLAETGGHRGVIVVEIAPPTP